MALVSESPSKLKFTINFKEGTLWTIRVWVCVGQCITLQVVYIGAVHVVGGMKVLKRTIKCTRLRS